MLSVDIAGRDIRTLGLGVPGPVTVEYGPHGPELATWDMMPDRSNPLVRGNALVDVYDGGFPVWCGTLVEPDGSGKYMARGLWRQAERAYPFDGAGNLTGTPDVAIFTAVFTRKDVSWTFPAGISGAIWTNTPSESMTLADLLNGYCAENGLTWYIGGDRGIRVMALPTTPQWVVPFAAAGHGLTPADDEFYTHLDGRYRDAGGVLQTATVGSAEAAEVFGRRPKLVLLTDLGNTTLARAQSVLQGMLLKSGARMGYGEGLELAHGQITTPGGTAAALNQINSLQMVRLAGTIDTSRPYLVRTFHDIVLETVRYTDGARTITVTPFGYAARSFEDTYREVMANA